MLYQVAIIHAWHQLVKVTAGRLLNNTNHLKWQRDCRLLPSVGVQVLLSVGGDTNAASARAGKDPGGDAALAHKLAKKAAKEALAAQIQAKQTLLKLLKRLEGQTDPAKKALLRRKINKLLADGGQTAKSREPSDTTPDGLYATTQAAASSSVRKPSISKHPPLAGITSLMANTPAEQVRMQAVLKYSCEWLF